MYLLKCLTVLLVAALVSDVSALPLNNCTARYQAALEADMSSTQKFSNTCSASNMMRQKYKVS